MSSVIVPSILPAATVDPKLEEACRALLASATNKDGKAPEMEKAASELVANLERCPAIMDRIKLFDSLKSSLIATGKAAINQRLGSCAIIDGLISKFGNRVEPYLISILTSIMELVGDKDKKVREAGSATLAAVVALVNQYAVVPILTQLTVSSQSWQANEARLNIIASLCEKNKEQMQHCLPDIIPAVAHNIRDIKAEVSAAAKKALLALCGCCTNVDVIPLIPIVVEALEATTQEALGDCVHKLASTTFVEIVDSATLSIMCPILLSGFRGRDNKVKRSCARIVDNMTTLVEDSREVRPFVQKILAQLESAAANVPNPEIREVCTKAMATLTKKAAIPPKFDMVDMSQVLPLVSEASGMAEIPEAKLVLTYVSEIACMLNMCNDGDAEGFSKNLTPYLLALAKDTLVAETVEKLVKNVARSRVAEGDDEEIEADLCDCNFSLAYGNKVLLKKTRLRLHRGLRYGVIGKNDCGKTSLLKAIAEYRVEGFPSADQLRTVLVETDIKAEYADMNIVDFMFQDESLSRMGLTRDQIIENLQKMGFVDSAPATIHHKVGALSGGWRMKLALTRAMLLNADILLFDEPTNHLDAYNVKWVEDYLTGLKGVTSIMVSHDSGLLNRVCTNIIQIDQFKLEFFKGNLSAWVEKNPAAKAFFELKTEKFAFHFPNPGPLPGVTTKGKPIIKMDNISFTYPTASKPQLKNVTCQLSLGSRVACVGVNGAGKSTMIKLLTGELEPDAGSGKIWTHPNCRVGYIAQHAFHHIDKHLNKTANEYVRERYNNGNDAEEAVKVTNLVTPEEAKMMQKPVTCEVVDPSTEVVTKVSFVIGRLTEGRRQNKAKNDQEYEATKVDSGYTSQTYWVLRKELVKNGWEKVLLQVDQRIANRAAFFQQPLSLENVKKHFENVGLEEEFSTHMRMGALSGGQKVKVVLGAAMWNKPHILILDEPTNYLDRDSLGALAAAIREFEGGVVMITHNSQFCDNLSQTVWHLENNTLNIKGDAEWMQQMAAEKVKEEKKLDESEMTDKFGNTVVLKQKKIVEGKDLKKKQKEREKINRERKKKGLEPKEFWTSDEEDDD